MGRRGFSDLQIEPCPSPFLFHVFEMLRRILEMIWLCRVLMLFVFALFWGGLTFYTGFVVRVSHEVLNDPFQGGLITQEVTVLLQYLGIAAGLLMLINAGTVGAPIQRLRCGAHSPRVASRGLRHRLVLGTQPTRCGHRY